jgi:hypothetical protein
MTQHWTEAETVTAENLYRRLSSRRLRATHPDVIALADRLGRAPTAVAAHIDNLHHAHNGNQWRSSEMARKVSGR